LFITTKAKSFNAPAALMSSTSASQIETGDSTTGAAAALKAVVLRTYAAANCGPSCKAAAEAICCDARKGSAKGT
jgi:hypothetical protein